MTPSICDLWEADEPEVLRSVFIDDFRSPNHQEIMDTIIAVRASGAKPDTILVANLLERRGTLAKVGGREYLARLIEEALTGANLKKYIEVLREARQTESLKTTGQAILDAIDENTPPDEIADKAVESIDEARWRHIAEQETVEQIAGDILEHVREHKTATGVRTFSAGLRKFIPTLKPKELIVVAGTTGTGKTSFALTQFLYSMLRQKASVFFSLEMSRREIVNCLAAQISKLDSYELAKDKPELNQRDMAALNKAMSQLVAGSKRFRIEESIMSLGEIRHAAGSFRQRGCCDIVFVDYLQLVRTEANKNESRETRISRIAYGLKQLAQELDVPVVAMAQLNRQADVSDRPRLFHLRESGAIEQAANIVVLLWRDKKRILVGYEDSDDKAEANVAKHRGAGGRTGLAILQWRGATMSWEDPAKDVS